MKKKNVFWSLLPDLIWERIRKNLSFLVTKTMVPDFSILASRFWFANPWFIYLMLTKMGKKDLVINFLMIFGYLNSDSPFPRYKMRGRVQYMTIFRQVKVAKNWTSSLEFQNWSKMSIFFQTELRIVANELKSFPNLENSTQLEERGKGNRLNRLDYFSQIKFSVEIY